MHENVSSSGQPNTTPEDVALRHVAKWDIDRKRVRQSNRRGVREGAKELRGAIRKRVIAQRCRRHTPDAAKRAEDDDLGEEQQVSAGEVVRISRLVSKPGTARPVTLQCSAR
jgi:hypothetical protein